MSVEDLFRGGTNKPLTPSLSEKILLEHSNQIQRQAERDAKRARESETADKIIENAKKRAEDILNRAEEKAQQASAQLEEKSQKKISAKLSILDKRIADAFQEVSDRMYKAESEHVELLTNNLPELIRGIVVNILDEIPKQSLIDSSINSAVKELNLNQNMQLRFKGAGIYAEYLTGKSLPNFELVSDPNLQSDDLFLAHGNLVYQISPFSKLERLINEYS